MQAISRRLARRIDHYLLLLLLLSLLALTPLLAPGYFYTAHDGRHSVFFVTMFDESLRDGALWPRWAMHHNQGYGYPTFLIQAPLAFYVAELFVLFGFGITNAVKIAWGVGFLAGAWGVYALVQHWLQFRQSSNPVQSKHSVAWAAVVAGLLYTYAPYHLLDMYVRAAFAETMLMAWLPWVFLAFDHLIVGGTGRGWQRRLFLAALSYAGLLLTHVFALPAVTPLLVAFVLFRLWCEWREKNAPELAQHRVRARFVPQIALAAAGGIAALLLTSIFVLPLLVEGPLLAQEAYVRATYHYERHWVYWGQFFSPFWGYGFSDDPVGVNDGMGFQIGVMLGLLALCLPFTTRNHRTILPIFLLLSTGALLFAMTPAAGWLWRAVPTLAMLQFPWRLLALVAFLLSALGGLVLWQVSGMTRLVEAMKGDGAGLLVIGMLVLFAGYGYSQPAGLQPIEPWREDGRAIFQFEQEHPDMLGYTDRVEERFTETPMSAQYQAADFANDHLERLAILAGEGEVTRHYSRGHSFGGEVTMATPGRVQVRVFDFPGWQVRLNHELIAHRLSPPHALIEVDVPAGHHQIDVRMGTTPVRTLGAAISGLTMLALIALWGQSRISQRAP